MIPSEYMRKANNYLKENMLGLAVGVAVRKKVFRKAGLGQPLNFQTLTQASQAKRDWKNSLYLFIEIA